MSVWVADGATPSQDLPIKVANRLPQPTVCRSFGQHLLIHPIALCPCILRRHDRGTRGIPRRFCHVDLRQTEKPRAFRIWIGGCHLTGVSRLARADIHSPAVGSVSDAASSRTLLAAVSTSGHNVAWMGLSRRKWCSLSFAAGVTTCNGHSCGCSRLAGRDKVMSLPVQQRPAFFRQCVGTERVNTNVLA